MCVRRILLKCTKLELCVLSTDWWLIKEWPYRSLNLDLDKSSRGYWVLHGLHSASHYDRTLLSSAAFPRAQKLLWPRTLTDAGRVSCLLLNIASLCPGFCWGHIHLVGAPTLFQWTSGFLVLAGPYFIECLLAWVVTTDDIHLSVLYKVHGATIYY